MGAILASGLIWVNGEAIPAKEIKRGDEVDALGYKGPRKARVERVTQGSGKGTVWLHGASGAQIRCLWDQRVAVSIGGRRRYRRAGAIKPGDFVLGLVSGTVCVDPIVAVRTTVESVPAIYLEMPSVTLISEEGLLCRPAS